MQIKHRFINKSTISDFYNKLDDFNFLDTNLVRPSFDLYFMRLAWLAATRSNCMKRGNGAVVVKDNRIVSTGYNGTPKGLINCNDGGCTRCNENTA
jgi:dCMP deaminase